MQFDFFQATLCWNKKKERKAVELTILFEYTVICQEQTASLIHYTVSLELAAVFFSYLVKKKESFQPE